ncbi:HEPN domain-containing protein [Pseudomonas sp. MF6767]|uniref:HEPN domain-containing protein n=1 Tax=Pseudomonas sp. MF6767 TaxID=2797531 RepID=UPI0018E8FFBC|nr:HEPN domain-containing protein [Pseudomonas sp. MF6767]MBJ2280139.1 HEPN domain-containing protein [Pseudomonas sp. MF6767]
MTYEIDGYDDDYERPSLVEDRNHRNHWLNRANDLHASAGAIWYSMRSENHQSVSETLGLGKGFSMHTACNPVYHMLCGLSLEVLMKAVLVSRGDAAPEIHDLNELASLVGTKRNINEKRILRFYQESVVWAGRYPIPRKANDQMLRQYWNLANKVLTKPKDKGKETFLTFYVASGATYWEKYDALYKNYSALFDHRY